jgi:hypothetical protein
VALTSETAMIRRIVPAVVLVGLVGCADPVPPAGGTGASRQAQEAARSAQQPEVESAPPPRLSRQDAAAEAPVFRGHTKEIRLATFNPDYTRLVTVSDAELTVRIWDAHTGLELVKFGLPTGPGSTGVYRIGFSRDGRKLVTEHSGWPDAPDFVRFRVWDASTGKLLREARAVDDETRWTPGGPPGGDPGASVIYSDDGKRKMPLVNSDTPTVYDTTDELLKKPLLIASGEDLFPKGTPWYVLWGHSRPGPDGLWSRAFGLALSRDGKLALLRVDRCKRKEQALDPPAARPNEPMRPVMPIVHDEYVDSHFVLVDVEKAEKIKRTLAPKEQLNHRLYFFRDKRPFALASDQSLTTLSMVNLFPK